MSAIFLGFNVFATSPVLQWIDESIEACTFLEGIYLQAAQLFGQKKSSTKPSIALNLIHCTNGSGAHNWNLVKIGPSFANVTTADLFWNVQSYNMMTSSNGNIFRVTGHLCGEFTGPGEFPTQRPVTRSFDVFFDLRLNKRLSKQPWGWWFETPSWSLWRQCNELI